jgi:hypothetical protein
MTRDGFELSLYLLKSCVTAAGINGHMADEHTLMLLQADQARADFALIKSDLRSFRSSLRDCRRAGDTGDRARHHLRDDDADNAELAVLSAVVGKI